MKKSSLFRGFSLVLLGFLLTGCGTGKVTSFVEYKDFLKDTDDYAALDNGIVRKAIDYKKLDVKYGLGGNETISYSSFKESQGKKYIASKGNTDFLVIPVEFKDARASDISGGAEKAIIDIQNAFFGDPKVSSWESVSSYYNKSSYGKLSITGKVSDWFTYQHATAQELVNTEYKNRGSVLSDIAFRAVEWYKANNSDISRFDKDGDGNPDSLRLVYSLDYINSLNFFWAYTIYDNYPVSWLSYKSLNVNENGYTNPMTAIHETGHVFGLQDYYDYSGTFTPTGYLDMMDYNLGDHSPFSKMLLNWTRPLEVHGVGEVKINSFTESGDVILIGKNWNGTAMDEYILVAFYTPTNLNMHHSKENYDVKLFTKPGVIVYHVDARMRYENAPKTLLAETKYEEGVNYSKEITLGFSNSATTTFLLEMIGKNADKPIYARKGVATNDDLFVKGDKFGDTFRFHSGELLPYSIEIKEITNGYATIQIK